MKKLSKFEKFGIIAAIIIACTFYYVKRVYEPQEIRLKKTVQELNKVVNEINNLGNMPQSSVVKRSLEKYRKELDDLNGKLDGMLVHTGTEREVTNLLSDINAMMAANDLRVNNFAPKGRTKDELLEWNRFEIDMEGSFHGYLKFLKELQEMRDAVKIQDVIMEKGDGNLLHIKMKLMI